VLFAACATHPETSRPAEPHAVTIAPPPPPESAAQPSAASTSARAPAKERRFGLLKALDEDQRTLTLEPHDFLTGDEADEAAREEGVVGPDEGADNDYWVADSPEATAVLPVAAHVEVLLLPHGRPSPHESAAIPIASSFRQLAEHFRSSDELSDLIKSSLFVVRLENGEVVGIEEFFVP
jgi:hypothetical protein